MSETIRTGKHMSEVAEAILRLFIATAIERGLILRAVHDGEASERVSSVDEAITVIDSVEDSTIVFRKPATNEQGFFRCNVFVIPSNDGHCLVDWHDVPEFEAAITAVQHLIDAWEA